MLAELEFPGEDYFQVLARIHEHLNQATYLEMGVDQGQSFEIVTPETIALGVDPDPQMQKPPGAPSASIRTDQRRIFRAVRCDFRVRRQDRRSRFHRRHAPGRVRPAGFHQHRKLCSPDSIILIHDVYPIDATSAARERVSSFWTGDIWRLILTLNKYRPDLSVNVIATGPTGLAIVQNLDPNSRVLAERNHEIIDEFLALDISMLDGRKDEMLNRFPTTGRRSPGSSTLGHVPKTKRQLFRRSAHTP